MASMMVPRARPGSHMGDVTTSSSNAMVPRPARATGPTFTPGTPAIAVAAAAEAAAAVAVRKKRDRLLDKEIQTHATLPKIKKTYLGI